METSRYFGLQGSPFDGQPDPRFYCRTPSHAETLATLQYAAHSHKACTLVLGESGSGKTLLGRLLAEDAARRAAVLWVHGLAQADGLLHARFTPAGGGRFLGGRVEDTTLPQWLQNGVPDAPVIIVVDNADGLREAGWQDVLALITRGSQPGKPLGVVLLGLPELMNTIGRPELVRVQRRVFRTCRLARLNNAEVALYVNHRLRVAGAGAEEIFTPAALEMVHRFSDGNPAIINQLCENAMVDAFSEDRKTIDARHILATAQAVSGGAQKRRCLPGPGREPSIRFESAAAPRPRTPRIPAEPDLDGLENPIYEPPVPVVTPPPLRPAPIVPLVQRTLASFDLDAPEPLGLEPPAPLDERLRSLESRLSQALARVRDARQRPRAGSASNGHSPARPAVTIIPVVLDDEAPAAAATVSDAAPAGAADAAPEPAAAGGPPAAIEPATP